MIVGGTIGHGLCTGVAVLGGRFIAQLISPKTVTLVGGVVFLCFALSSPSCPSVDIVHVTCRPLGRSDLLVEQVGKISPTGELDQVFIFVRSVKIGNVDELIFYPLLSASLVFILCRTSLLCRNLLMFFCTKSLTSTEIHVFSVALLVKTKSFLR